jgi:putative lipoprotein
MNARLLAALVPCLLAGPAFAADAQPPVDTTPRLAFGQMIKQGGKLVFAPCRDRSYAMVEDVSPDGRVMRGLNAVGLESGKKLYVELIGVLENGILKASEFNMARTEGRCQLPGGKEAAWAAGGNEPGWNMQAGGERVLIQRLGKTDVRLPHGEFKREGEVVSYAAAKDGNTLALRFEHKLCLDTMAEAAFGWTAVVTLNGQAYKGCAWQR